MYTDFFNAAAGTGSEMASASDLPSDLQLHQLHETPSSLMAAVSAPSHQDGADTLSKAPLCWQQNFLKYKKWKEILGVRPHTSQ